MIYKWALILIITGVSLLANTDIDEGEVNVHQLVQKQIENVKTKEENQIQEKQTPEIQISKQQPVIQPVVREESKTQSISSSSGFTPFEMKLVILGSFSSLVLFVVGIRRIKKNKFETKNTPDAEFKKNIQMVRAEKFIRPIDPKLKKIRTNLYLNTRYLNETNSSVSDAAKKLNIAKTELILAARFNRETGSQPLVAKQRSISKN